MKPMRGKADFYDPEYVKREVEKSPTVVFACATCMDRNGGMKAQELEIDERGLFRCPIHGDHWAGWSEDA